jgi:putative spermidine/putrescine transport system permease protein
MNGIWTRAITAAVIGSILTFLLVPVLAIIPMSFNESRYLEFPPTQFSLNWYEEFFTSSAWMESAFVSVQVAVLTTVMALLLGVPAAFGIVRGKLPFEKFLLSFFALPIVFPIVVSAVGIYYIFVPLKLINTSIGLAIAHTMLALPVVIFPTIAALKRFDPLVEWQALNLGASRTQVFLSITMPMLRPTFVTAILFSFITSFDEIVFAIFIAGGSAVTLPRRIWESLRFEIEPTVTVVATILIVFSTAIMVTTLLLQKDLRKK